MIALYGYCGRSAGGKRRAKWREMLLAFRLRDSGFSFQEWVPVKWPVRGFFKFRHGFSQFGGPNSWIWPDFSEKSGKFAPEAQIHEFGSTEKQGKILRFGVKSIYCFLRYFVIDIFLIQIYLIIGIPSHHTIFSSPQKIEDNNHHHVGRIHPSAAHSVQF